MIDLVDEKDPLLLDFRKKVIFEDCENFPKDVFERSYRYEELKRIVNNDTFEDGWRFSNEKFNRTKWHHILVQKHKEKIVTFSGAILHGKYLKVGVFHYFLNKFRTIPELRGSLFRSNGFIYNHIVHSKDENIKGVFFTVFEHNTQLSRYVKYLHTKKFMVEQHNMNLIHEIKPGGIVKYKGVPQSLFYLSLSSDFDLEELKNELRTSA